MSAPFSTQYLTQRAKGFLGWWARGLSAGLPQSVVSLFSPRAPRLVMQLFGQRARLSLSESGTVLGTLELDSPQSAEASGVMGLPHVGSVTGLVIEVRPEEVLRLDLEWPLKVEANLEEALKYQLDKLIPLPPEAVYLGHHVVSRDYARGTFSFELVAVPRGIVDPWVDAVCQGPLAGLPMELKVTGMDESLRLAVDSKRSAARAGSVWGGVFVVLLVVLLVAAVALPFVSRVQHLKLLDAEIEKITENADQASALRQRLQGSLDVIQETFGERSSSYSPLMVLEELAMRTPDDAYLQNFSMDGSAVTLGGEARSSTDLVEALQGSPMFDSVEFAAPVSRVPKSGRDRFQLRMQLGSRDGENAG